MEWFFNDNQESAQTRSKVKMQRQQQSHSDSLSSIKNSKNVPYEPDDMDENDPVRQYKVRYKSLFEKIKTLYGLSTVQSLFLAHLFENKSTKVIEETVDEELENLNLLGFDLDAKHLLLSQIPELTNKSVLAKTKSLSKLEICKLVSNDDIELMTNTTSANQKLPQLTGIHLKNVPVKAGCWSVVNTGMTFNVNDKAVLLFVLDKSHSHDNNNGIYVQEVAIDGKDKGLLTIHCYCPTYYNGPDTTSFKLEANLFITGKKVTIPSLNIRPESVNLKKFERTGSSDDYANIWNIKTKKEDNIIWDFGKYPYLDKDKNIEAEEIANNSSLIFLSRKRNFRDGVSMGGIVIDDSGNNKLTMMPKNMKGNNTCAFQAFYKIPARMKEVETFKKPLPASAGLNGSIFHDVPIDYKEVKKIFCKISKTKQNITYQNQYLNKPEVQRWSEIHKQNLAYLLDKVNWNKYGYNDDNFQVACDIIESVGNIKISDEDIGHCFAYKTSTSEILTSCNDLVSSWLDIMKKNKCDDDKADHHDFDKGEIIVSNASEKTQLDISKEEIGDTIVNIEKTPQLPNLNKIENMNVDVTQKTSVKPQLDIQDISKEEIKDAKVNIEERPQLPNLHKIENEKVDVTQETVVKPQLDIQDMEVEDIKVKETPATVVKPQLPNLNIHNVSEIENVKQKNENENENEDIDIINRNDNNLLNLEGIKTDAPKDTMNMEDIKDSDNTIGPKPSKLYKKN